MEETETKDKWFRYLSEQGNDLRPVMTKFFNEEIDFDELNIELCDLGLLDFYSFRKNIIIDTLLIDQV